MGKLSHHANNTLLIDSHCVVVMDDCFYLIGGTQDAYLCFNDVWRSNDAIHWRSLSDDCMWQARWQHTCVVHANCLFILGGWGDGHLNDVWKSSDCGNSWKCICPSAPWRKRMFHASVSFNNLLFVIGGSDGKDNLNVRIVC